MVATLKHPWIVSSPGRNKSLRFSGAQPQYPLHFQSAQRHCTATNETDPIPFEGRK